MAYWSVGGQLGVVHAADRGVRAVRAAGGVGRAAVAHRVVAHVPVIGAPRRDVGGGVGRVRGVKLVSDSGRPVHPGGGIRGGVDASPPVHLARVGGREGIVHARRDVAVAEGDVGEGRSQRGEVGTVGLGQVVGRLTRDLRDVVVQAGMPGGEILFDQLALRAQGPVEVGGRRARPEGGGEGLVLQVDHQDVGDRARLHGCPERGQGGGGPSELRLLGADPQHACSDQNDDGCAGDAAAELHRRPPPGTASRRGPPIRTRPWDHRKWT